MDPSLENASTPKKKRRVYGRVLKPSGDKVSSSPLSMSYRDMSEIAARQNARDDPPPSNYRDMGKKKKKDPRSSGHVKHDMKQAYP